MIGRLLDAVKQTERHQAKARVTMKNFAPTNKDALNGKQSSSAAPENGLKLPLIPPASIRSAPSSSSRTSRHSDKYQAAVMAKQSRFERDRQVAPSNAGSSVNQQQQEQVQQANGFETWPSVEQLFKVSLP